MTLTATSHDWNTPFRAYDIEFIGTRVLTVGNGATADGNMGVAVWDRSTSTGRLWLTSVALAAQKCLAIGSKLFVLTAGSNGIYVWDFTDWDLPTCALFGPASAPSTGFAATDGTYLCTYSYVYELASGSRNTVSGMAGAYLWHATGGVGYACQNNSTNLHVVNLSTHTISSTVTLPRKLMIERNPIRTITYFDGKLWFATNDLVPTMMTYRLADGDVQVFTVTTPGGVIPTQNVFDGVRYMGTMLVGPDDLFYAFNDYFDVNVAELAGVFDPATLTWWTESFAATPTNQRNPRFNGSKLWTVTGTSSPTWP